MAPMSVNGVTTTGWPQAAIVISPSDIASSKRFGEFTEITVNTAGESTSASRSIPRAMAAISMPSRARSAPIAVQ